MVNPMTMISSGLSMASMVDAIVLQRTKPEVSTALMWFSVVTSITAVLAEATDVFEHKKDWSPDFGLSPENAPPRASTLPEAPAPFEHPRRRMMPLR